MLKVTDSFSVVRFLCVGWFLEMALSVEYRTCNQEVMGSILRWAHGVKTLGKFHTYAPVTKHYKLVLA